MNTLEGWTGTTSTNKNSCGGSTGIQNILGYLDGSTGNEFLKKDFSNLGIHDRVQMRIELVYK